MQFDKLLSSHEILTASERLTLLRSEIDLRHGNIQHAQTQRLARWAIAVAATSVVVGIVFGAAGLTTADFPQI
jgi:hypothetical protein